MITINLLSPEQKQDLKTKRIYLAVKELINLILLFTIIIALMLLGARYILENQLAEAIEKNATTILINQRTNQRVNIINKKISEVEKIQIDFKHWSELFRKLSLITPDNVQYTFIKVYNQTGVIEIQGAAQTRQDLLRLQQNLGDAAWLSAVELPLSDLLAKENNLFNIKSKVDLKQIP